MARESAGLLLYRRRGGAVEVFLVHPGGPFWAKKDAGAWSIPKGEVMPGEEPLARARQEFTEETGFAVPAGAVQPLQAIRQAGGKRVHAWAIEGDCDASAIHSNRFTLEWPPRSGKMREFPEIDRAQWFDLGAACEKINPGQKSFIDELARLIGGTRVAASC